jgi:hypothetical protein
MNEETSIITKPEPVIPPSDSNIFGVSVRAWIAIGLVFTVCGNHLTITVATMLDAISRGDFGRVGTFTTIGEPLYSLATLAIGFYFGQKTK